MKNEVLLGGAGTALSVVGTALQVNEILQTISLIITIVGGLVSLVAVPLLTWYKNAKKDGKIDAEEAEEGAKTLEEGIKDFSEHIKKGK